MMPNRTQLPLKLALAASLSFSGTSAVAYFCPQYMNEIVFPVFVANTAALVGTVASVDAALSAQLEINSQRMQSAVAILTKQKAIAANQIAEAERITGQTTASGLRILAQTEAVKKARFDYSGEFGQGVDPCGTYSRRVNIANQDAAMGQERRYRVVDEVVVGPGRYADPIKAADDKVREHEKFCTEDQAASGLCKKAGPMAGASLTFATLFEPAVEGEDLYTAKVAFVNNVVGLPDAPLSKTAAKSSSASAYVLAKARKDAFLSPAINSLKEIQLDYSSISSTHGGTGLPLAMQFEAEVKRYSGNSKEYDTWSRTMIGQNQHGALVEQLKIKALDLALMERQYRQYERMESNLATLVAMEVQSSGMASGAQESARDAARQQMTRAIK